MGSASSRLPVTSTLDVRASQMQLPDRDAAFLQERSFEYELVDEGGMLCVLIKGWGLPEGYTVASADLLLRLSPGYPDVPPDMWWFEPALVRLDGGAIQATEVTETVLGRSWQRWSRHLDATLWNSGTDGLESYFSLVHREVAAGAGALV